METFPSIVQRMRAAITRRRRLVCRDLVELITAYFDDALDPVMRQRFEAHLEACDGCAAYLAELRATVATVRAIGNEDLDPVYRERLMDAFAESTGSW